PAPARPPAAGPRPRGTPGASVRERGTSHVSGCALRHAARAQAAHSRPPPASAARSTARAPQGGSHAVALPRRRATRAAVARDHVDLVRALAAAGRAAASDRAWPAAAVLGLCALLPLLKGMEEAAAAMATVASSLRRLRERESGGA